MWVGYPKSFRCILNTSSSTPCSLLVSDNKVAGLSRLLFSVFSGGGEKRSKGMNSSAEEKKQKRGLQAETTLLLSKARAVWSRHSHDSL